jgi:hypothetical protein
MVPKLQSSIAKSPSQEKNWRLAELERCLSCVHAVILTILVYHALCGLQKLTA